MLQVSATVHLASSAAESIVRLIDISKSGVAFVAPHALENGAHLALTAWLPGGAGPTTVGGTIVYCLALGSSGMYRVGAQFGVMSDETLDQIRDFVSLPPGQH
jgi:hypothetical protein